ncbi:MAG TPA: AAA family ATPase [Verrucomicrobia bacterium]|nr:AAA family ATPase [Verrucomicrobiota bacterium]
MKPITTSVYTFCDMIEGRFLYVDKTEGLYGLIRDFKAQYFLARPRRFGKSLMISTLKAIFQGRRELFDGLFIASTDYDWKPYPVIHLDMGSTAAQTPEELSGKLIYALDRNASALGVSLQQANCADRFLELVNTLTARDGRVVILVDEYDKPLLGHLGQPSAKPIQNVLKQFYSVIKTTEACQRFALITGVSKFTKVSIFSDLNNLTDLTMDARAATLLGYTQSELEANFQDYIDRLAGAIVKTRVETLDELRIWYNGYRFHHRAETVYNPVSVMKCFDNQEFRNYWFETGTPTFLVDLLRESPLDLGDLQAPDTAFSTYDPADLAPLPLLVQTGYLTIKGSTCEGRATIYQLGFPNFEIEESFSYWLVRGFSRLQADDMGSAQRRLLAALRENRIADMLEILKVFFAKVPNTITIENEKYYQTIFFTVFTLIGVSIETEVSTNIGRIDAVVKTSEHITIFEFKLNGTADAAMAQIRQKRYAEPYLDDGRPITLVGVEFSGQTRNLGAHRIEAVDEQTANGVGAIRETGEPYITVDKARRAEREDIARRLQARGIAPDIIADVTGAS